MAESLHIQRDLFKLYSHGFRANLFVSRSIQVRRFAMEAAPVLLRAIPEFRQLQE